MRLSPKAIAPIVITVVGVIAVVTFAEGGGASQKPSSPVTVVNTQADPVPVTGAVQVSGGVAAQQSGTWSVGLSGPVEVAPPSPITSGGNAFFLDGGGTTAHFGQIITASALSIEFSGGAKDLILSYQGNIVARIPGNGTLQGINLALSRPINFDEMRCGGNAAGVCDLGWIGNKP